MAGGIWLKNQWGGGVIISNKKSELFVGTFLATLIILLIVFRSGEHFSDVDNYIAMYKDVLSGGTANTEFSFVLFSKISVFMGVSYLGLFLIYALISIYSKYFFLRRLAFRPTLVVILYGISYFILYEFVQMRAGTALGVFLVALVFYSREETLKSLVVCFLASFIHYSIIPLVILLFSSPILFKIKCKQFLGLSLFGFSFSVITIFFIFYFVLMSFFPVLDFRYVFIDMIYSTLNWILPSRIYEGYFGVNGLPVAIVSMKQVLSIFLATISVTILIFGLLKREWIYYFSCFMVISSFWVYFFFGNLGVITERLSEILLLFIIVVIDGVIKSNKAMGYFLFCIISSVFLINLLTRASYFEY